MSQKVESPAKSKWWKRLAKWDKEFSERHPKAIWITIIVVSVALSLTFFLFSIPFGVFIILSPDAVRTLIETEATILGFFGLIAVYLLTSYDNRIDKLEEKILDIGETDDTELRILQTFQWRIKNRKRRASNAIISALISLILSIFLTIVTLGLIGTNNGNPTQTAYQIAIPSIIVASTLLFIGGFLNFLNDIQDRQRTRINAPRTFRSLKFFDRFSRIEQALNLHSIEIQFAKK
jgi:hypothetical protein